MAPAAGSGGGGEPVSDGDRARNRWRPACVISRAQQVQVRRRSRNGIRERVMIGPMPILRLTAITAYRSLMFHA
jgi:hypothetical protein